MTRSMSPTPSTSSSDVGFGDMMEEPASYRPATPPPTSKGYTRRQLGHCGPLVGQPDINVHLVSGHPLWGHVLYPAAIALSRFLELHAETLLTSTPGNAKGKGKAVIELGAGGGLPGLVAALEGAEKVVVSDFPDPALVNNIAKNIADNVSPYVKAGAADSQALGFTWGSSPSPLLEAIGSTPEQQRKFDLVLLSDLVFNHSQHGALLDSCEALLADADRQATTEPPRPSAVSLPDCDLSPPAFTTPAVLCFFSHHRPTEELIKADMGILTMAKARGWRVTRVWKDEGAGPAFPEDGGDLCIRSTVHGFAFTRS